MNVKQCDSCGCYFNNVEGSICSVCQGIEARKFDDISKPSHYNQSNIEPIEVIEDWKLDARLANVIKYIYRHNFKGSKKKDMKKALWYLERYIQKEIDND